MINDLPRKTLNVDRSNLLPLYTLKEHDDVILKLALFKNSVSFDITGQTIRLGAKTSAGLKEQNEGFTIDKSNLDIVLKNSILSRGLVELDLQFIDANGQMTTASFFISVGAKVLNDNAVEASNEFDTFKKTVEEIQGDYQGLRTIMIDENNAANLQDQVNQVTASLEQIVPINIDKYSTKIIPSVNSYEVDVDLLNNEINTKATPVLNLSQKNYVLSKPLILKSRTSIFSYGAIPFFDTENKESISNTVISSSVVMDNLIIGENIEGVYISGVTIDGCQKVTNGIKLTNSKCITIENSLITHCVNGLIGDIGQLYQLDKVTIKYNSGYGMKLNQVNDSNMDMVYFTGNVTALEMTDCGTWSIIATKFEWNRGYGIRHIISTLNNADSIKIINCTFHQNNMSGIRADKMTLWGITNNYFNGNGNANINNEGENCHIYCNGGGSVNIISNSFQLGLQDEGQGGKVDTVPYIGLKLSGTYNNTQIIGNKLNNSATNLVYEFTSATFKNSTIQINSFIKMYDLNGNLIFDTTSYAKPNKTTSSTRPTLTGSDNGLIFYETDTDSYIKWDGVAFRPFDIKIGGTLPIPSSALRGKEYVVFGQNSNPDKKYICLWTGSSYKWYEVGLTVTTLP